MLASSYFFALSRCCNRGRKNKFSLIPTRKLRKSSQKNIFRRNIPPRLSHVKELQSIVDYETSTGTPCINTTDFPLTKQTFYWSSTSNYMAGTSNLGWVVSFINGSVTYKLISTDSDACLRAVRGGL
ncbi:MAG TPA: DUF1566 domain-containing protein [Proteobacteria bacterium]|nr:DUF1566 domain-containing protein [Pseudomonadota bacterium]